MTHTPGPWTKIVYPDGKPTVIMTDTPSGNGLFIAEVANPADAPILAAAPDMLAALRRASDALLECSHLAQASGGDWTEGSEKAFYAVEAAIAKATNTQQGGSNE